MLETLDKEVLAMMRVPVFDSQGKRTQDILEFDEEIFGKEVRKVVLKEAILMYEARQRLGCHSTKTRKDCSGSGRKLWRQKGTGRARVGPSRPPHHKGGGVVFGPHPRSYSYSMPKKAKKAALNSAWLAKFQDREVCVIEGFNLDETPKTSVVHGTLAQMGIIPQSALIGTHEHDATLWKSARNISGISVERVTLFNPYILIRHKKIVLVRKALEEIITSRGGEIKIRDRKEVYS
jgi:large subunit ribosomal protein L4